MSIQDKIMTVLMTIIIKWVKKLLEVARIDTVCLF